ncbi:MAG: hypothetical protein KDD51_11860 [Bdellovibrionales bacterium]|nr:hypothetical protein [Bdellovibrionales bacterium]
MSSWAKSSQILHSPTLIAMPGGPESSGYVGVCFSSERSEINNLNLAPEGRNKKLEPLSVNSVNLQAINGINQLRWERSLRGKNEAPKLDVCDLQLTPCPKVASRENQSCYQT